MVNCEINLIFTWSKNCLRTSKTTRDTVHAQGGNPAVAAVNNPTDATFRITDTKFYVPVVTLSTEDDSKLLVQLKTGFKRTIKWNKYRSGMPNETKTNKLNYLIDPIFHKAHILFMLSFQNEDDRALFSKCYTPNVEIKYFILLIDGKSFFDVPIKKKQTCEMITEMNKNSDDTTSTLLDYDYFSNHYKLIAIDLNKKTLI